MTAGNFSSVSAITTPSDNGHEASSLLSSSSSGPGSVSTKYNLGSRSQGLNLPLGSTRAANTYTHPSSPLSPIPFNQTIKSSLFPPAQQQSPVPLGRTLSSSDQLLLQSSPSLRPSASTWSSSSSSSPGYPLQDQSFMQEQQVLPPTLPFPAPAIVAPSLLWPPASTTQEQPHQPVLPPSIHQQLSSSSTLLRSSSSTASSKNTSPWFPSIPASSCQGIFQFTIDGIAYLKKINQSRHNVTLQIESSDGDPVSAKLWIDRKDNSDAKAINFDIKNIENNCKSILYNKNNYADNNGDSR